MTTAKSDDGYKADIINKMIQTTNVDTNTVSDGYHTFGELYEHRTILYLALISCAKTDNDFLIWYSDTHYDGEQFPGWLIVGIENTETGEQISYHIEDKYEYLLKSLGVIKLEKGKKWDGHTSQDVIDRLLDWFILG